MKKKKIPIKNYVYLAVLIVVTVFTTFKLANMYKVNNDYFKNKSPLFGTIFEIKLSEFDNYLLENPNAIIYIVDGNKKDSIEMDNVIKELVIENDLSNEMKVINATHNNEEVLKDLKVLLSNDLKKYEDDLLIRSNVLVVKDGMITDILTPITMDKELIVDFLIKNGAI
ncbi:MAG: hypothetical protein PHI05_03815 [Bacilli bacterium]|nr:hypothetical protein [Bacilli bacterium]MDD4547847.1 hypothetical protein [Bacilli bacterium]